MRSYPNATSKPDEHGEDVDDLDDLLVIETDADIGGAPEGDDLEALLGTPAPGTAGAIPRVSFSDESGSKPKRKAFIAAVFVVAAAVIAVGAWKGVGWLRAQGPVAGAVSSKGLYTHEVQPLGVASAQKELPVARIVGCRHLPTIRTMNNDQPQ